jgi:type IV pilus assembly protein PilQ
MAQNHVSVSLAVLLLPWGVSTAASATAPTEVDQIGIIESQAGTGGGQVVVHGTRPAIFSVYRLTDPDRIVLDLAGADVSHAVAPAHSDIDGITGISAVQFQKEGSRVGRVVLDAPASMEVDARVRGNDVILALTTPGGMGPPGILGPNPGETFLTQSDGGPSVALAGLDGGAGFVLAPSESGPTFALAQPDGGTAPLLAVPAPVPEDHLVDRREDLHQTAHPGHRVLSATAERKHGEIVLTVRTDGPVADLYLLRLQDPPRVAVDVAGMSVRGAKGTAREGLVAIRFGSSENGGRVVFDLGGTSVPEVRVHRVSSGLALTLGTSAGPAPQRVVNEVAPVPLTNAHELVSVKDLQVVGNASREQVMIDLPAVPGQELPKVDSEPPGTFQLRLEGAGLPGRFQRTLDASELGGPISTVSSYNVDARECRVVVAAAPGTRQELKREGNRLVWSFQPANPLGASAADLLLAHESAGLAAGYATTTSAAKAMVLGRPRYTGRRISMEFQDIELVNLLRLFAEISHRNIVVSDDVKGRVTLSLRDVPWDQAFALILETHSLGKEESGNIIRVAPQSALEKERRAALDAQKSMQQLEPLRIRLIPVNYALAGEVSDRGVVTVDTRTNVLIVKDVAENLTKAEGMVRNLDTQTPQVLIESRIVEAATTFTRELGIQWGGNGGFSPATGNPTGLVFPSTALVSGAAGGVPNLGTAANPNFAVNLPAAIGPGSGGGLGFIFGSAGGAFNLNLRLSAMESNGVVKTVSAPKVATLDNQEADISQGLSIPFAQVSAAGVQTQFVEARLELKVTPHVTSDGSVLMKISATNNHPDPGITGANGQPAISRKEAKTQMLVKDGDTTVIGGIYTRDTGLAVNEVPFFGKIPVLGWLFKHRTESDDRTELLIFITPRILNRQQVVSAGG